MDNFPAVQRNARNSALFSDGKTNSPFCPPEKRIFKKSVDKSVIFYLKNAKKAFFAYFLSLILPKNPVLAAETLIFTFPGCAPEITDNVPFFPFQSKYMGLILGADGK